MITTHLLVLGAIALRKEAHGYVVYRDLMEWRADTWACIKPGSIYHALTQLEKKKLVEAIRSEAGQKGGARTLYTLTGQGEQALQAETVSALESLEMDKYSAGIALSRMVPHEVLLRTQRRRLEQLRHVHAFMCELPKQAGGTPAEEPALVHYWTGFFAYNVQHAQALIQNLSGEVQHEPDNSN